MSLAALNDWYVAQCNGDWEHQGGLTLQTLDNPGWALTVRFDGVSHSFPDGLLSVIRNSDDDWMNCLYEPGSEEVSLGCSPNNLEAMVAAFLVGVEGAS